MKNDSINADSTTSQVDPSPLVEETIDVYPQEVTAEISWFGDTWMPYHFNFDRRRR